VVVVVESQTSWNGDLVHDKMQYKVNYENNRDLENMFVLSDFSKQKHGVLRRGVCVNEGRLNDMCSRVSAALQWSKIKLHSNIATNSTLGKGGILKEFEAQLRRFVHFEKGSNSSWDARGNKRKNNSGKSNGKNDDISDAFHMLVSWWYWFNDTEEYTQQRRMFGIE